MCLIGVAMTAWSQNLMLNQKEPENEIAVVGYFCKNDTMTYRQSHIKYKIENNDTTVSESYEEEFMIVVTDSTSKGYKMKYIPLSFTRQDADTDNSLKAIMTNAMSHMMQSVVCEFTTDEFGSLKSITNWREIRDQLKKSVKATCDSLYSIIPSLSIPRKSLEDFLLSNLSTEEDIRDLYEVLETLFGMHGSAYDICDKEEDIEEQGLSGHVTIWAGYTPIEEEGDIEGDYAFSTQKTLTIPVEDMKDTFGALSMIIGGISGGMASDSLEVAFDQIVDSLKIAKPNGAEVTSIRYNGFFLNGWPKIYYHVEGADLGFFEQIEIHAIEWKHCHWEYIPVAGPTDNNDI